jgi:decaprenyl-phosphate phosphoribosyltransferase
MTTITSGLWRTARPKQWLKNMLVFAAPAAAGALDDPAQMGRACVAFVAFCLAASGIYFWNDAFDVEADRRHPTKRSRPIAAGIISPRVGFIVGSGLVMLALCVATATGNWQTPAVVGTYVFVTLLYSSWLKHVPVVDIVTVAAGFVLRATGGAVAVDVPLSNWFLLVTVFGSLFVVSGKRYSELREIGEDAAGIRQTLTVYTLPYLRLVLTITCGAALLSYCQWALGDEQGGTKGSVFYELSIVPMLVALLRYGLLLEQGRGAAPEDVFANDRVLQFAGIVWTVALVLAVYVG